MTKNSTNDLSTNTASASEGSFVAPTFSLPPTSNGQEVISAPSSFVKGEVPEGNSTRPEPETNSENVLGARPRCSTNPKIDPSEGSNFAAAGSAWVVNNARSIVINIGIYAAVEESGQHEVWIWIDDPPVYPTVPRADKQGLINKGTVAGDLLSEVGLTECFASVMRDMIDRHCKAMYD
ncbi:hypothetical protein QFC21_006045 [Naganishia friedmannii]|uniref:Uncharacterized protein n=1 Tax=Naganishia friedmannii TaxID=89922 RepID=A0ACC2V4V2_9TREE|nr:hypothetical protein QFC21_006045 [Naganishia friedmannii]